MTYSDIVNNLSDLTIDELSELNSEVIDELKHKRRNEARKMKRKLSEGDQVTIQGGKLDGETGEIIRVKRTKALVDVDGDRWNIPMDMLEL